MEIIFNPPKDIVIVPEVKKTLDKIVVLNVIDSPERKIVTAMATEVGNIVLWEGAAYDAIGQWTDTDVINRIEEIYQ